MAKEHRFYRLGKQEAKGDRRQPCKPPHRVTDDQLSRPISLSCEQEISALVHTSFEDKYSFPSKTILETSPPAWYSWGMNRFLLLTIALFAGTTCLQAGVIVDHWRTDSESVVSAHNVLEMLSDDGEKAPQYDESENSDMAGPEVRALGLSTTSVATTSPQSTQAAPKATGFLSILNSQFPPIPDLDGLIKPPQVQIVA